MLEIQPAGRVLALHIWDQGPGFDSRHCGSKKKQEGWRKDKYNHDSWHFPASWIFRNIHFWVLKSLPVCPCWPLCPETDVIRMPWSSSIVGWAIQAAASLWSSATSYAVWEVAAFPTGQGKVSGPVTLMITLLGFEPTSAPAPSVPAWQGRSIGTTKLRLVEFSAFLEQQRDPDSVSMAGSCVWNSPYNCFSYHAPLFSLCLKPARIPVLCVRSPGDDQPTSLAVNQKGQDMDSQ